MRTWYELWDSESANLIGSYASELEALRVLREALAEYGSSAVAGLVLTEENDATDDPKVIAAGADLIRYVDRAWSLTAS